VDPWTDAMRRGDFATAWSVCDEVLARRLRERVPRHSGPRHLQYVWDGRPLVGARVLVRCYHGLGDTLQFVRFLPRLRARAREVVLWAQPALLPLLATADGVDRLLPLHDGVPEADYDVELELMELPHALRIGAGDLPGPIPYLHVAPVARGPSPGVRNVGLTWRAGEWDADRSVPDALMARLADAPGVRWSSLQYGVSAPAFAADDLACRDAATQARRMASLDLIVTVDTMTAHLAGALGLPVWLLLAEPADWRWMAAREDSPWYPTMRLFRQPSPGDWDGALTALLAALAA
jgi:hypothetical protein